MTVERLILDTAAAVAEIRANTVPGAPSRHVWIDNLRVAVIAGVVVCHVSASYAVPMPWYYEERTAGTVTVIVLSALFGPPVMYAMAVLFLVAGMLAPRALTRKGQRRFIADRLMRLGIPLVVSTVLLVPLTDLIGAAGEGDPQTRNAGAFLIGEIRTADTGVMWFAAALLLFSVFYAGLRRWRPAAPRAASRLGWRQIATVAAVIAAGSFTVRLAWPALGLTPLHLNFWDWPAMAAMFGFGVMAGERGWLDGMSARLRRRSGWAGLASTFAATAYFAAVVLTGDDRLLGGWYAEAMVLPLIEAALVISMCLWLVGWFQDVWNRQGRIGIAMSRASYAAYVLHPLVIVMIGALLRQLATPAELKFVAVSAAGVVLSFGAAWALTRIRPLARVL